MKRTIHIILLLLLLLPARAEDTTAVVSQAADTLKAEATLQPEEPVDSIDIRLLEWMLAGLDTTPCLSAPDTSELPDNMYKQRLQALPCVVELPYNPIAKRYIQRYIKYVPRHTARIMRESEYYFPIFEDALSRHGLPYELKYVPVIESALRPMARSRAGAAGLWQFMPSTAKRYGLEVNSLVDERYDVYKSTEAACVFLQALYNIFNDWNLAIAAYNCGAGNVKKAIRYAGGKRDFWSIYPYLPHETRMYVPLFIASNYVFNYAGEHGICPDSIRTDRMLTDTIVISQRMHLKQVAEVLDIPIEDLRYLNPQYTRDILPGNKDYRLCLPLNRTTTFIEQQDSILAYQARQLIHDRRTEIDMAQKTSIAGGYMVNGTMFYKIRKGDTLGSIAKKFHVTVSQLQKWNGLKGTNIYTGKNLRVSP